MKWITYNQLQKVDCIILTIYKYYLKVKIERNGVIKMFKDVKDMTTEDIMKELQAIELYEKEIGKVNVVNLLEKNIDTSFLAPMQCTLTPNGQLFRVDKLGFLPAMMEEMYEDRKKFKNMMLKSKQELENVKNEMRKRGIKND